MECSRNGFPSASALLAATVVEFNSATLRCHLHFSAVKCLLFIDTQMQRLSLRRAATGQHRRRVLSVCRVVTGVRQTLAINFTVAAARRYPSVFFCGGGFHLILLLYHCMAIAPVKTCSMLESSHYWTCQRVFYCHNA